MASIIPVARVIRSEPAMRMCVRVWRHARVSRPYLCGRMRRLLRKYIPVRWPRPRGTVRYALSRRQ